MSSYEAHALALIERTLDKQNYLIKKILEEMMISNYLKMAEYNKRHSTNVNMEDLRNLIGIDK